MPDDDVKPAPETEATPFIDILKTIGENPAAFGQSGPVEPAPTTSSPGAAGGSQVPGVASAEPQVTRPATTRNNPSNAPKKPGPVPTPFRTVGSTEGTQISPQDTANLAFIEDRRLSAQKAVGFQQLQASLAVEESYARMNEIADADATAMQSLIDVEFPKWQAEVDQLERDVDEARRLQVNPFNFMQSIGRAGAAASVVAVGLSQLAAGAGNANSVMQRVDAAIERDITAQKANIELAFKGIDAKRNLLQDDVALLEQQFAFQDKARAVAYAAVAAEAGRAKQHAQSEMQYIANQMMEEEALARSIAAKSAAMDKLTTIYVDGRVASMHQAMSLAGKFQQGVPGQRAGQVQVPDESALGGPIRSLDEGIPSEETVSAAPAAAPPSSPAAPEAAPSQANAARVARRRPSAAATGPITPDTTPPTSDAVGGASAPTAAPEQVVPEPPTEQVPAEEADRPLAQPGDEETLRRLRAIRERLGVEPDEGQTLVDTREVVTPEVLRSIDQQLGRAAEFGSFAAQLAHERGDTRMARNATSVAEGAQQLLTRPEVTAVFDSVADAEVALDLGLYPPPNRKAFRGDAEAFQMAQSRHQYLSAHPELFVKIGKHAKKGKEGEFIWNYMRTQYGNIRLAEGSFLARDDKARAEVAAEVNASFATTQKIREQANAIAENGVGTIAGFSVDAKDGLSWNLTNPDQRADFALMASRLLGIAIGGIKGVDPAGRLTDKDIDVGKAMMAGIQSAGTGAKSWDLIQAEYKRLTGQDISQTDLRQSAVKFFAAQAEAVQYEALNKVSSEIVLGWAGEQIRQETFNETSKWLDQNDRKGE